jgi:thiamine-monophosphate kinase
MASKRTRLEDSAAHRFTAGGERKLLAGIRARARSLPKGGVALGIGDDCALLRVRAGEDLAVTTDLSIDGRHFHLGCHPAQSIGHRTLARGLSDLAGMGARPVAAFLSLGLPAELVRGAKIVLPKGNSASRQGKSSWAGGKSWIDGFLEGFLTLAKTHGVPFAGGDLAESPVAVADIVLVGAVRRGKALLRSGARPGDALYVTGSLGAAAAGLARLLKVATSLERREPPAARPGSLNQCRSEVTLEPDAALAMHLSPQPRVAQGLALVRRGLAKAAIDLSDGLSTDLDHLCEESGVAAEVEADAIPIGSGATLEEALHGGEDYELLFAAASDVRVPRALGGVAVTRIGKVVRRRAGRPRVLLVGADGARALDPRGWEHFS